MLKGITMNTPPEAEPHIYAEDDASIYQSIFGSDGVFNIGSCFKSTVLSNNKVRIADGVACIGGHMCRQPFAEYTDMEIVNGQTGKSRNDIIVAKFVTTGNGGVDTFSLNVVQGAAGTTATDPALTKDNIYESGKIRELPLYRVKIEGLSIVKVEQLFKIVPTIPEMEERINELNSALYNENWININGVYCRIKMKNGYVTIIGMSWGELKLPANEYKNIATLPEAYRPNTTLYFTVNPVGFETSILGCLGTDGILKMNAVKEASYWAYSFTFPIN